MTEEARIPTTGTVHDYDERGGYGYIIPDEPKNGGKYYIVHRKSLRNPQNSIKEGDRVIFSTENVPRGTLAIDVRPEFEESDLQPETSEGMVGRVTDTRYEKNFGFISLHEGRRAFFHTSSLVDPKNKPPIGSTVQCNLITPHKGLQARDVVVISESNNVLQEQGPRKLHSEFLLPQAVLARDVRDYRKARKLYEQGLKEQPSVQLVLSYAAMEKNLGNFSDAMKIYEKGIALFPRVSKLHEDAGVLATSMSQLEKAIALLSTALELCRTTTQGGEKGVLLALARVHYRRADRNSLASAVEYYEAARTASGRRSAGDLPARDNLSMNLAKIRLQHYRGNLVYNFLLSCRFPIIRASLHSQTTLGADIIVQIETPEMMESYGISGNVLVRCIFKSSFTLADLNDMDSMITSEGNRLSDFGSDCSSCLGVRTSGPRAAPISTH